VLKRSTLPNLITVTRILLAPVIFYLVFVPSFNARLFAFVLFLVAAFSDLWDGHLARKYGWITDFGKLFDPIADKLLLVATLVPFYLLTRPAQAMTMTVLRSFPLWVLLVILGRELLITVIRSVAARRGVIIPAGKAGKLKAVFQNIFIGATILWFAVLTMAQSRSWSGSVWAAWQALHSTVLIGTLVIAVVLTVYSMAVYLWEWRRLVRL
jgi:CDP-diacylglycerol--glycerol-3-phosphate 3-phosphatidyltransferase